MILGSHNSWSYAKVRQWYLRPFSFIAKCQHYGIIRQYKKGVRSFDLRLKFDGTTPQIVHNKFIFDINYYDLCEDLYFLNVKGDSSVRILLDIRNKKDYTAYQIERFVTYCKIFEATYPNIKFYGGSNLYNGKTEYKFEYNPTIDDKYASVAKPKYLDDWYPWIYAKFNNKKIYNEGTDKDILLMDFIDII